MKNFITYFLLLFNLIGFSQFNAEVRNFLIEKYPPTWSSNEDKVVWIFNDGVIHEFEIPFIINKLKSKLFFKTSFSYFYDIHGSADNNCLIIFDKETKSVIMNPPQKIDETFYRNLIGLKLNGSNEIKIFAKELGLMIMCGDKIRVIEKTIIKRSLITYEIRLQHQDTLHEIIEVQLNNNSVVEIRSLTPKWKNVSVSIK